MDEIDVLVVGAGPTGLTLACELGRRGIRSRIIERSPEHPKGARGKGLQPRTQEVFDDLGVLDAVLAAGGPYPEMHAYRGAEVVWKGRISEPVEPTPDAPYPNILMIPQWRTEAILCAKLAEFGGAVELGTELADLMPDEHGVTVTLTKDGVPQRIRARYLVGADGGRSTVRKSLGIGFHGTTHETQRMVVADVRVDGISRETWHIWQSDDSGAVALCPMAGTDTFQYVGTVGPDDEPDLTLEGIARTFAAATGRTDVRVSDLSWVSLYRTNIRMVERFRSGPVFLAGDAAHVHSPAGGQGLNTGVQDAYNLGWKLAAVLGGADESLLDSYEQERMPIAADVLGISTELHERALVGGEDALFRGANTKQLGVNYRLGPLAEDTLSCDIRAGDRAPDAPCVDADGKRARLFDLFRGPQWTVLGFGADTAAFDGRPDVRVHQVDSIDAHGHIRAAYPVPDGALALIRPDGYIGALGADVDRILRYLDRMTPKVRA